LKVNFNTEGFQDGLAGRPLRSMDEKYLDDWASGFLAWNHLINSTVDHFPRGMKVTFRGPTPNPRGKSNGGIPSFIPYAKPTLSDYEESTHFESRPPLYEIAG